MNGMIVGIAGAFLVTAVAIVSAVTESQRAVGNAYDAYGPIVALVALGLFVVIFVAGLVSDL